MDENAEAEPWSFRSNFGRRAPNEENDAPHGDISAELPPGKQAQLD